MASAAPATAPFPVWLRRHRFRLLAGVFTSYTLISLYRLALVNERKIEIDNTVSQLDTEVKKLETLERATQKRANQNIHAVFALPPTTATGSRAASDPSPTPTTRSWLGWLTRWWRPSIAVTSVSQANASRVLSLCDSQVKFAGLHALSDGHTVAVVPRINATTVGTRDAAPASRPAVLSDEFVLSVIEQIDGFLHTGKSRYLEPAALAVIQPDTSGTTLTPAVLSAAYDQQQQSDTESPVNVQGTRTATGKKILV